jgi:hypothetical protein
MTLRDYRYANACLAAAVASLIFDRNITHVRQYVELKVLEARRAAGSLAIAQRFEQEGKGRRVLTTARIVEVIAGKGLAPLPEHAYKFARTDERRDVILGQIREPCPLQSAQARQGYVADNQLCLNAHVDGSPRFLEVPDAKSALRRVPQADGRVLG